MSAKIMKKYDIQPKIFCKQLQPCQEATSLPRSGYSVYNPALERSDYVGTADAPP